MSLRYSERSVSRMVTRGPGVPAKTWVRPPASITFNVPMRTNDVSMCDKGNIPASPLASTLMQSTNHGVSEMTVQVANIFCGVGCQVPVRVVGQAIMQKQGRRTAIQLTAK